MDRRAFISAAVPAAALLSGCLASDEPIGALMDNSPRRPATAANRDADAEPDRSRYVAVESDPIETLPLDGVVRVLDGDPRSPDSPVRIEVTLTNASERSLVYGERRAAQFWNARTPDGFTLRPDSGSDAESTYEFDEEAACWVATEGFATTMDFQTERLEPGESVSETLVAIVGAGEEPPESPPDSLSFDAGISVSVGDDLPVDGLPASWGFTLALDENGEYVVERGVEPELPLRYAVDLPHAEVGSSEDPVRVEVSLTNDSNRSLRYGERRTASFWWRRSGAFTLYPEREVSDEAYERDADTGRWVATEGYGMTMDYQIETLGPGETHTESLLLLVESKADEGAIPEDVPTDLSFESSVSLPDVDGAAIEWGFSLQTRDD